MGSFYTNITVRQDDVDAVAAALEQLGRTAFVSPPSRGSVVVFDEGIESQDLDELKKLARALSRELKCATLSVLNHDDDVLYYALHDAGRLVDEYTSRPGYFEGRNDPPSGGDARAIAEAFGALAKLPDLRRVLHQERFTFEVERHEELVRLLGAPPAGIGTGFNYIRQGELPEGIALADLRAVGNAESGAHSMDPEVQKVVDRLKALVRPSPALAAVIGPEPVPYGEVPGRIHKYLVEHDLIDMSVMPPLIVVDDRLRALFGDSDRVPYMNVGLVIASHVSPL